MNDLLLASPNRLEIMDGEVIRGTASSVGNVDYVARCFLPGAFLSQAKTVPFLLNHEDVVLGESTLVPTANGLRHESRIVGNPVQPKTGVPIRQLLRQGYNATSIGWVDTGSYYGWSALEFAHPELAKQAEAMGVTKSENVRYFTGADIKENSLCAVGANPQALLDAASLLPASEERTYLVQMAGYRQNEIAAGARHSQEDAQTVQQIHDMAGRLGAACPYNDSSFNWTSPNGITVTGRYTGVTPYVTGGNSFTYTSGGSWPNGVVPPGQLDLPVEEGAPARAAHKYSMPDGSYPIDRCTGKNSVASAAKLAHHSKTYSFEQVRRHVMKAKNGLNCPDSVLPENWGENSSDLENYESAALQLVAQLGGTDSDDSKEARIQAIDACLDEAMEELHDGDLQQGLALVNAADAVIDQLMADLGIYNPSDEDQDTGVGEPAQATAPGIQEPVQIELSDEELGMELTMLERKLEQLQ